LTVKRFAHSVIRVDIFFTIIVFIDVKNLLIFIM
jgi:hypothetical protein